MRRKRHKKPIAVVEQAATQPDGKSQGFREEIAGDLRSAAGHISDEVEAIGHMLKNKARELGERVKTRLHLGATLDVRGTAAGTGDRHEQP
jgi:hypothetical protein